MPKYKRPDVCKPCWELKYCPYGGLPETMPIPWTEEEIARFITESPSADTSWLTDHRKTFERIKRELTKTDPSNDEQMWSYVCAFLYNDPEKFEVLKHYDPRDIECGVRDGHACPVFFYANRHATETIAARRSSRYVPREIMLQVVRRDDYRCRSCGDHVRDDEVEFDHVIPYAKGGPTTVENIRLLCRRCNRKKGDSLSDMLYPQEPRTGVFQD